MMAGSQEEAPAPHTLTLVIRLQCVNTRGDRSFSIQQRPTFPASVFCTLLPSGCNCSFQNWETLLFAVCRTAGVPVNQNSIVPTGQHSPSSTYVGLLDDVAPSQPDDCVSGGERPACMPAFLSCTSKKHYGFLELFLVDFPSPLPTALSVGFFVTLPFLPTQD